MARPRRGPRGRGRGLGDPPPGTSSLPRRAPSDLTSTGMRSDARTGNPSRCIARREYDEAVLDVRTACSFVVGNRDHARTRLWGPAGISFASNGSSRAVRSTRDGEGASRMKRNRWRSAALVVVACIVLMPATAWASPNHQPLLNVVPGECDNHPGVTQTLNGFTATIVIVTDNGLPTCEPVEFTLTSWNASGATPPTAGPETPFDSDTLSTIQAGTYTLTVGMPPCFWQTDLAKGIDFGTLDAQGIPRFHNLVAWQMGGHSRRRPSPSPSPSPRRHPRRARALRRHPRRARAPRPRRARAPRPRRARAPRPRRARSPSPSPTPTPSPSPSPSPTPSPTVSDETVTPSPPGPTVSAETVTPPGVLAFTGSEDNLLLALLAMMALLVAGSAALWWGLAAPPPRRLSPSLAGATRLCRRCGASSGASRPSRPVARA